jgi:hypothetical protein
VIGAPHETLDDDLAVTGARIGSVRHTGDAGRRVRRPAATAADGAERDRGAAATTEETAATPRESPTVSASTLRISAPDVGETPSTCQRSRATVLRGIPMESQPAVQRQAS